MTVTHHQSRLASDRYRLFWRWHLYAGLFVAPFLLILAVTGAVYLFSDELNDTIYHQLRFTPIPWETRFPLETLIDKAEESVPGASATRIDMPADNRRAAQVHLVLQDGSQRTAFMDPATAAFLGQLSPEKTLVGIADRLHGSLMLGKPGSYLIELTACWSVLLILSGLYLGWPRENARRWWQALLPNVYLRGRQLWRSLHVAVGLWVSLLVLFLIFTGLPWAAFWGNWVRYGAELIGEGYPAVYRRYMPVNGVPINVGDGFIDVPWTLQQAPLPQATQSGQPISHHEHHPAPSVSSNTSRLWNGAGLERAYSHARTAMPQEALRIFLPGQSRSALMIYTYPSQPQGQVTWHFDPEGEVIVSTSFSDYGRMAQAIELGVQLHMGNYFGRANQLVMLFACLGVIVMVISGTAMWWKRRPVGRIGAPKTNAKLPRWAAALLLLMSAFILPLLALSLISVAVFDRYLRPRIPGTKWLT